MKLVVLCRRSGRHLRFCQYPCRAPASKGDPKAAESIVNQVCAACHSVDGNSAAAANPKLAGLNPNTFTNSLPSSSRAPVKMPSCRAWWPPHPQDMQNLPLLQCPATQARHLQGSGTGADRPENLSRRRARSRRTGLRLLPRPAGQGHSFPVPAPGRPAQRLHLRPAEQLPRRRARERRRQDDAQHRRQDDRRRHEGSGILYSGLALNLLTAPESMEG